MQKINKINVRLFVVSGMQRVHDSCYEFIEGTESYQAYNAKGNRKNGSNYSQEIFEYSDAIKTVDMRGSYDFEESFPRRKVRCRVRDFFSLSLFSSSFS